MGQDSWRHNLGWIQVHLCWLCPHHIAPRCPVIHEGTVCFCLIYDLAYILTSHHIQATDNSSQEESEELSSDEEEFENKLDCYLKAPHAKKVNNPLQWWYINQGTYPHLWRMARDYLTIPGMYCKLCFVLNLSAHKLLASLVAVERVFSKGHLLLSHVQNWLSAESTCALLCLGYWDKMGYIMNSDLLTVANLPNAKDDRKGFDIV